MRFLTYVSVLLYLSLSIPQAFGVEKTWPSHPDDGKIVEQTPFTFSVTSQEEWLGALTDRGVSEVAVEQLKILYPSDDFNRYKAGEKAEGFRITYMSEGLKITGFMIRPKRINRPRPVIIYNHGGVMKWGRIVLSEILEFYRLAEQGYIVLASNFRGTHGSEGKEEMGGGDITDILNLINVVDRLESADKSRIAFWGFSRGGAATYKALTYTDRISAAVIQAGPVDYLQEYRRAEFHEHVFPYVVPGYNEDKDAALRAISALYWAERIAPVPILLLHGQKDKRVLFEDSIKMASRLQNLGRDHKLMIFEDGNHTLLADYVEVRRAIDHWLIQYVSAKGQENYPQ